MQHYGIEESKISLSSIPLHYNEATRLRLTKRANAPRPKPNSQTAAGTWTSDTSSGSVNTRGVDHLMYLVQ